MPTYIDESGDTGRVADGGRPFFRLAAVWVPDEGEAERFRRGIRGLRTKLGLRPDYEFKFAKTLQSPERRRAFLDLALARSFWFAVSNNDKTRPEWADVDGPGQQRACVTELAALLRPIYCRAAAGPFGEAVVVDDNHDRGFLAVTKRQFRGLRSHLDPGGPLIGKVSFRDSARDEMLQLVDMICGAVGAYLDQKKVAWYGLISARDVESPQFHKMLEGHPELL